ncbi:hypothetical protein PCK2_000830 [Pneumocystis canis]|nr:hypothetical protein PCK2_000830 [Pneumocystis canis]
MLKKRDQGGMGEKIGEEELLALILKENTEKEKCKIELKKYCKALHDAKLTSEKVHEKLEAYCEKDGKAKEEKCTELKNKVDLKCKALEKELKTALGEPFTEEHCTKHEYQCHFLEGAYENLIEPCSQLRNQCYQFKRTKLVLEIFMRALSRSLKKGEEKCKEELTKHCVTLSSMSQELMWICLNPKGACESLITEAEKECKSLKTEVEKEVKNETCLPLLEECHFYGPNCEESKTKCDELRTECEEKYDIMYIPPEEPWFPIQPMPDIADKVGLEELYEAAAKKGVQKSQGGNFDKEECKKINETRCDYLKKLVGNSKYNCKNIKEECEKLNNKHQQKRKNLEERIQKIKQFNGNNGHGGAKTIPWHELDPDFNGRNCAQLQSDCFFLSQYKNDLETECNNIQAMCYKKGLNLAAYEVFEDQMRGEFQDLGPNEFEKWSKKCQKKLVEVCKGVKNQSYHLLGLCLEPKETCSSLYHDILDKTYELSRILYFRRDSPKEHDCLKLEPKCDRLKKEDTELLGPCHTLEKNCRHLRETQQLKDLLLGEKKNLNIVRQLNGTNGKMDELRELCPRWAPYCDALLPSCQSELADERNNKTLCPGIQKYCQPYQEREALENQKLK